MDSILNGLNQKQKNSVEQISGPVLVVAGPGSGKTRALTHRIAYLIYRGTNPKNILAMTFTNKAAGEMRDRVARLLSSSSSHPKSDVQPLIGTFHSVCARILRREARAIGFSPGFTIYDEEDKRKLLKDILKELSLEQKQFNPAKIQAIISSLKDRLTPPGEVEADTHFMQEVCVVYEAYQAHLKKQNAMDFDDLIMKTVDLFEKNPAILRKYQEQFKYILVDEFQDTNLGQYKIAKQLAAKQKNIYCIGDLDQSIYSFRGADYRNILRFEKDWPDAKTITLEQNYRSTQNILDVAKNIISHNRWVVEKNLWTENGRGEPIVIKETDDEMHEGEFIVSEIEKLVGRGSRRFGPLRQSSSEASRDPDPKGAPGLKLRDFVVLYRTNAQSRAIEESFLKNSMPYKIIGGIKFYQRKEVKDLLAWLRLCVNPDDKMAVDRVSAIPIKFLNVGLKIPGVRSKSIIVTALLENFREKSSKCSVTELLAHIIKTAGFEKYLRDDTEKGEDRWSNIGELVSVSLKYNGVDGIEAIRMLVEEASLAQDTDNIEYEKDLINLMTLHSAKGLEFPVVFMAGCEQGLLPHARTLFGAEDELEEERRLCYVGVTRAKEKLYMVFARTRMMFGKIQANPPSEFLGDIPENLVEFMPSEEEYVIELD